MKKPKLLRMYEYLGFDSYVYTIRDKKTLAILASGWSVEEVEENLEKLYSK